MGWMLLDPAPPSTGWFGDKLLHFAGFFAVSIWCIGFCRSWPQLIAAGFWCAAAAIGFEAAQALVPSRLVELGDLLANVAGAAVGIVLAGFLLGHLGRRGSFERHAMSRP